MIVVFGFLFGSFLGVMIERSLRIIHIFASHRTLTSASYWRLYRTALAYLLLGRSKCEACGKNIHAFENIPVFSYLYLRGACSACGVRIPASLFYYEVSVLLLSVCLYFFNFSFVVQLALLFAFALLLMISVIDWRTKLIPDALIYALFWLGVSLRVWVGGDSLLDGLLAAIVGYVVLKTLQQIYVLGLKRDALGDADPLLVFALAVWLRVEDLPYLLALSSIMTLVPVLWMRKRQGALAELQIPFGPGLSMAGYFLILQMAFNHSY